MEKEDFAKRLTELRINKGVSARDMSLSIGQSAGYINNIENGVNLPSMMTFFYICEYLGVEIHQRNPEGLIPLTQFQIVTHPIEREVRFPRFDRPAHQTAVVHQHAPVALRIIQRNLRLGIRLPCPLGCPHWPASLTIIRTVLADGNQDIQHVLGLRILCHLQGKVIFCVTACQYSHDHQQHQCTQDIAASFQGNAGACWRHRTNTR